MTFDDRILYLRSIEQPYLSISDPYLEMAHINKRDISIEKTKWLIPNSFNSLTKSSIEPRKNMLESKIPIPISGEVRLKFKQLVNSKNFSNKLFRERKNKK